MSDRHKLPVDFPIGFRGLVLNEHRDVAGDPIRTAMESTYEVTLFDFSALSIRDQVEGLHVDSGADLGVASKEHRRLALRGLVKGETAADLEDRVAALFNAFDVEEAIRATPSTKGVSVLDFYCPTANAPTGFTSPVHEAFFARPRGWPVVYERKSQGLAYLWAAELICEDPLRYLYDETSVVFNTANGWSLAMPNWAAGQGVLTFPVLELVLTGAGHAALTISDGATSLVLDMSTATAGTFTVDMKTTEIIKVGVGQRNHVRTSGLDSFFGVPAGGATWAITNRTNLTSVTATYRMARS